MVVLIEVIGKWVTRSDVANRRHMVADSNTKLRTCCPRLYNILCMLSTTCMTLDELHGDDPGLKFYVASGKKHWCLANCIFCIAQVF